MTSVVLGGVVAALRSLRGARATPAGETRGRHSRGIAVLCFVLAAAAARPAHAAPLDEAAQRYRLQMIEGIGQALAGARALQERIAAHDLEGARKAWIGARAGWERSEVFTAGFVPELDAQIDAWPSTATGFHAIEARLFGAGRLDAERETDALVADLSRLDAKMADLPLTPQGLLDGTVRLAYEVGESKSDGGESRISGTSLDDMRNNVDGIRLAYQTIFAPAIEAGDPKLAAAAQNRLDALQVLLQVHDLKQVDIPKLRQLTEELILALQSAAPRIGLAEPALEPAQ